MSIGRGVRRAGEGGAARMACAMYVQPGRRYIRTWEDALLFGAQRPAPVRDAPAASASTAEAAATSPARDWRNAPRAVRDPTNQSTATQKTTAAVHVDVADAVASTILEHVRMAGVLGVKQCTAMLPTRLPCTLHDVSMDVTLEETHEGKPSRVSSPPTPAVTGGFSAETLTDPDAWLATNTEEASAPSPAPSRPHMPAPEDGTSTLTIQCEVTADRNADIEAIAGCMAATLALMDHVGAGAVQMHPVQIVS